LISLPLLNQTKNKQTLEAIDVSAHLPKFEMEKNMKTQHIGSKITKKSQQL